MSRAKTVRDELRLALRAQRAVLKHITKADYDHATPTSGERLIISACRTASVQALKTLESMLPKLAERPRAKPKREDEGPLEQCAAARDGECHHKQCPQLKTFRADGCPLPWGTEEA